MTSGAPGPRGHPRLTRPSACSMPAASRDLPCLGDMLGNSKAVCGCGGPWVRCSDGCLPVTCAQPLLPRRSRRHSLLPLLPLPGFPLEGFGGMDGRAWCLRTVTCACGLRCSAPRRLQAPPAPLPELRVSGHSPLKSLGVQSPCRCSRSPCFLFCFVF